MARIPRQRTGSSTGPGFGVWRGAGSGGSGGGRSGGGRGGSGDGCLFTFAGLLAIGAGALAVAGYGAVAGISALLG
jgi:hypothetical protein